MRASKLIFAVFAAVFAIAATTSDGRADEPFPSRTVKIIVPYPPGGGTDLLARVLAQQLEQKWKQSVIVENVGGAEGNIGAEKVAQAAPDGYTLLFAAPGPLALNSLVYKSMPYNPAKWVAIAMPATSPFVLAVSPDFAATNLAQVIAAAKAKPGALTVATPGVGGLGYFATIEFEQLAHLKLLHVPFQGEGPEVTALLGGHINMTLIDLAPVLPSYRAGKLKIVAAGTPARLPQIPNVPTLAESGVPGYSAVTFFGLVAPPGTPKTLADKINRDVVSVMKQPAITQKVKNFSLDPAFGSRADAAKFFANERSLWTGVAKAAGVKPVQ
jgi:tripartite-type tricarboxylate transporter receptor subunit TctC